MEKNFTILNLLSEKDIFDDDNIKNFGSKIHIRIQQRNGEKSICSVQGLSCDLDFKNLLKTWKKTMNCNGTILEDENFGKIIQIQGDKRKDIKTYLLENNISSEEDIIIHGF